MFCEECGTLMKAGKCPNCGSEKGSHVAVEPSVPWLTEPQLREEEHKRKQRKKQEVWKIPEGDHWYGF